MRTEIEEPMSMNFSTEQFKLTNLAKLMDKTGIDSLGTNYYYRLDHDINSI
jgi:hypothetical protein